MKPIAIIGLGNLLMGDEGVGIHATKFLRDKQWPDTIDIIDAGVPSLALLHMLDGRRMVIIIDCADFGGLPGEVKAFTPADVKRLPNEAHVSLHAADLMTTLDIAAGMALSLPPIWIVGIQPGRVAMGMELTDDVCAALDRIEDVVRALVAQHADSDLH